MTSQHDTTEGRPGYGSEHQEDDNASYERIKQGAEDFLKELKDLDPDLEDALVHTSSHLHLDNNDAREFRRNWEWKNTPIDDWDRTAQYRSDHLPPWMDGKHEQAAGSLTESFRRSMGHLSQEESKQASHHVAQILAAPIDEQLEAVRASDNLKFIMETLGLNIQDRAEHIKSNIAEGLADNNKDQAQHSIEQLAEIQHDFNKINLVQDFQATQQYEPSDYRQEQLRYAESMTEREAAIYQLEQGAAELRYREQASEILKHALTHGPESYNQNEYEHTALVEGLVDRLSETHPALVEHIAENDFHNHEFINTQRDWDTALTEVVESSQYSQEQKELLHNTVAHYIASEANAQATWTQELDLGWRKAEGPADPDNAHSQGQEHHVSHEGLTPHWNATGQKLSDDQYRELTTEAWKQLDRLEKLANSERWRDAATTDATSYIEHSIKGLQEALEGKAGHQTQEREQNTVAEPQ